MAGVLPMVHGPITARSLVPGDTVFGGESLVPGTLTTVGAGTWTGAAIASGIIRRTGPVGGYIDTTDTSTNILNALAGNAGGVDCVPGTTWRLRFINTVAQAMTWAAGAGVVAGAGTLNCAASVIREYLLTVLNSTPSVMMNCTTVNGSTAVTFVLPPGMTAFPYGSVTPAGIIVTSGMLVSGTGITAGTKVAGITQNGAGITGITLDTAATATNATGVALTFLPVIQIDALSV